MLSKRLSTHLTKLAKTSQAICRQFTPSNLEERDEEITVSDPLMEEEYTVTKGLIHKYANRALVLLTMNCAAYCRFCTRRRKVSHLEKGVITAKDLDNMVVYLKKHPLIKELIISGGDPLTVPPLLKLALEKFSRLPQIKILRVGSRLPVSNPALVNPAVISALRVVKKQPLYVLIHFEHPDEITAATVKAVKKIQAVCTMTLSQSVFLKGVNDNVEALYRLFSRLIEIGIKPYYIYRCDYVRGAEHFIVDIKKEIKIMTELRTRLSGLAYPTYVIDAQAGAGKIPVPLGFWPVNSKFYRDFNYKKIKLIEPKK